MKPLSHILSQRTIPYVFLAPFLIVFAVFLVFPLFQSVQLATRQTFGPDVSRFIGLKNFTYLMADPLFWLSLRNTVVYACFSVGLQMPLALGLALLLNQPHVRGRAFFRLVFFSPVLVGAVFVGVMFSIIFQKRTGLLNNILNTLFGFDLDFPWLQEFVIPALVIASLWMWIGYNMIYFLAALQNVSKDLVEASKVDGAGPVDRFLHVTLPAIRPVAAFVVLISMIGSFQVFELPLLLLNGPGPEFRGLTVVMYLYQQGFQVGDLGYASAIGWVLALILMSLALLQMRLNRDQNHG
jgi:ABC-type sugar transport system permease subunit